MYIHWIIIVSYTRNNWLKTMTTSNTEYKMNMKWWHFIFSRGYTEHAKMSRIHNSKSVRGRWLLLTGCVSSDKSAMASWTVRSVNYLNQVVCPLNRCIWYALCIMLLRNFPRGYFRAGSGGTVFNSILLCVFCTLINVYRWSSEYKKVTSKYSIFVIIYHVVIIHVH